MVLAGYSGCRLAPELLPHAGVELDLDLLLSGIQFLNSREVAIYKPRWSAFYNTPLEQYHSTEYLTNITGLFAIVTKVTIDF